MDETSGAHPAETAAGGRLAAEGEMSSAASVRLPGVGDSMDSDLRLVQACRMGDRSAFDRLYARHLDYVFNICLGVLADREAARDAAQEAFISAYKQIGRFEGRSAFSTWLYRVALNAAIAQARRRKARPADSLDEAAAPESVSRDPGPEQSALQQAASARVRRLVATLPPDYRAVLVLRYFLDLSYEEMQQVLGCNLGQVKIRLHRARAAFEKRWSAEVER